jgi:NADPH2:quinone reductase
MTKAIVIEKYGSSEVLKYKNLDIGSPKEDELLLRNTAIGVNYHDVYVRSGLYKTLKLPGVPGCEAAGVVEKIGASISDFKVGDRVAYITSEYGAYSSHININVEKVIKLPKFIGDELIATNFLRAMTVEMLLNRITVIDKTKTILVTAAAGGVGRLLCQWASSLGVKVIGSVSNLKKVAETKANGCNETLVVNQHDFSKKINQFTGGKGVDVVFDSVGKDTFNSSLESLAPCGFLVNFGQSSGAVDPLLMTTLAQKSLTVTRPILFHYFKSYKIYEQMAASVFKAFETGVLGASNFSPFSLKDAKEAHDMLESRKGGGCIYLEP